MEQTEQLRNEPVSKLIVRLSMPAIFSLLCNSINMAIDRVFISTGVGTLALSAVTVAFGLYLIMQACSQLISAGASSTAAIQLGRGNRGKAEKIVGNAFAMSVILAVLLSAAGLLCLDPLLQLYGADSENIMYAHDYAGVMFSGAICFVLAQSMNSIVRGMGYAKRALLNFLSSIIVNLILDAVFVFVFKWGVKGAAFATVIGNFVCMVLAVRFLCSRKISVRLHFANLKPDREIVKTILSIGVSGFLAQFALSIVSLVFNHVCRVYGGNTAVAAYGIISTLFMLVNMPMIGLGQGIQPVIGFNYGSKLYSRVKETLLKGFQYAAVFCVIMFLIFEILSPQIVMVFGGAGDASLSQAAVSGMRIYSMMTPLVGIQMTGANFFQYIGKGRQSIFLSALRQMILLIPSVLIFPLCFGMTGVWAAEPFSDAVSFVITMLLVRKEFVVLSKLADQESDGNIV